jgi:hypothetical protein
VQSTGHGHGFGVISTRVICPPIQTQVYNGRPDTAGK